MNRIFEAIRTIDEKEKLIEEIDILLNGLYQNKGEGLSRLLESSIRVWVADLLKEEFSKNEISPLEYLKNIKEELNSLNIVKICLAFEPTATNVEKFSRLVKRYLGDNTIIEFSYNPRLIAGCTIIFNGKYRDLSMKNFFESEFAKIKQDLFIQMAH